MRSTLEVSILIGAVIFIALPALLAICDLASRGLRAGAVALVCGAGLFATVAALDYQYGFYKTSEMSLADYFLALLMHIGFMLEVFGLIALEGKLQTWAIHLFGWFLFVFLASLIYGAWQLF